MKTRSLFLSALLAMTFGGCGDDPAPHGVSPSRDVTDLDADEVLAICRDFYQRPVEAIIPTEREACTLQAIIQTSISLGSEAVCRQHVSDCLEDSPVIVSPDLFDPSDCPTTADLAGCELTVGEIDACTDAIENAIDQVWDFSCADLGADEPEFPEFEETSECQRLSDTCPDLFGE